MSAVRPDRAAHGPDVLAVACDADLVGACSGLLERIDLRLGPRERTGWLCSLASEAGELVHATADIPHITTFIGIGYASCIAAIAAAVLCGEGRAIRVGLVPCGRHVPCAHDGLATWREWLTTNERMEIGATIDTTDSLDTCPFPDPLDPNDRDEMWSLIPSGFVVGDGHDAEWMTGSRLTVLTAEGTEPRDHLNVLLGALRAT